MTDVRNKEALAAASKSYEWGFSSDIEQDFAPKGLSEDTVRFISAKKNEPEWMLEWRLKAYRHWLTMTAPDWAKLEIAPIMLPNIAPRRRSLTWRSKCARKTGYAEPNPIPKINAETIRCVRVPPAASTA